MATKVKGIYKYITNIFVVKERELEIGGPTDVKHVAHIGWEGPSGGTPTWVAYVTSPTVRSFLDFRVNVGYFVTFKVVYLSMTHRSGVLAVESITNDCVKMKSFKAGPEFAVTSIGNSSSAISPWSSKGFGESTRQLTTTNIYKDVKSTSEVASPPKKHKRRKPKSASSPKSSSPSTLRSSRATKHKAKSPVEGNHTPTAIEVV